MGISSNIYKFKTVTGYNLQKYLLGVEEFTSNHLSRIVEYYTGGSKNLPSPSIRLLESLRRESQSIDHIININSHRFTTTDWWDLLDLLEDTKLKLDTTNQIPKWGRVSLLLSTLGNTKLDTLLTKGRTVENLVKVSLGSSNEHQDWYDIAISNDLREESYSSNTTTKLRVSIIGSESFSIKSVVDTIDSETIKGKDLDKKLTWSSDNDLKILTPTETFLQSVNILAKLMKGDNPEFTSQGFSKDLIVGQNINSISYPILIRQISELFSTDDTIDTFTVTDISKLKDSISMEVEIQSRSGEMFNIIT